MAFLVGIKSTASHFNSHLPSCLVGIGATTKILIKSYRVFGSISQNIEPHYKTKQAIEHLKHLHEKVQHTDKRIEKLYTKIRENTHLITVPKHLIGKQPTLFQLASLNQKGEELINRIKKANEVKKKITKQIYDEQQTLHLLNPMQFPPSWRRH